MLNKTREIVDVLKEEYNIDNTKYFIYPVDNSTDVFVSLDNNPIATVDENSGTNLMASFIANSLEDFSDGEISESVSDIVTDAVYKYEPAVAFNADEFDDDENIKYESELAEIARFHPYCKVVDKLIVSKEEDDGFILVDFDIDENNNIRHKLYQQ